MDVVDSAMYWAMIQSFPILSSGILSSHSRERALATAIYSTMSQSRPFAAAVVFASMGEWVLLLSSDVIPASTEAASASIAVDVCLFDVLFSRFNLHADGLELAASWIRRPVRSTSVLSMKSFAALGAAVLVLGVGFGSPSPLCCC